MARAKKAAAAKKSGTRSRSNVKTRGRGGKGQTEVAGTREVDDDIEAKATDYASTRDERMELNKEEKKKHDDLLATMDKKGRKTYPMGDGRKVVVEETVTRKVKVTKVNADDDEGEED